MKLVESARVERSAVVVSNLHERSDERAYWLSKTPTERLAALELMRQVIYGYDPSTTRLQRVLSVHHLKLNKVATARAKDLADLEELP
jgi:hypothetical protein